MVRYGSLPFTRKGEVHQHKTNIPPPFPNKKKIRLQEILHFTIQNIKRFRESGEIVAHSGKVCCGLTNPEEKKISKGKEAAKLLPAQSLKISTCNGIWLGYCMHH